MTHGGRARAAAALAAAGLGLGGCGEDRSTAVSTETTSPPTRAAAPPRSAEPPAAQARVSETEYRLEPARIRADRPTAIDVTVRNAGHATHALAVDGPSGRAETRRIAPGERVVLHVELDRPGRYRWYCPVGDHDRRGMRGSILVARP